MAWCRSDDKPLSEPVVVSLLMHICITRPQWVNTSDYGECSYQIWSWYLLLVSTEITKHCLNNQGEVSSRDSIKCHQIYIIPLQVHILWRHLQHLKSIQSVMYTEIAKNKNPQWLGLVGLATPPQMCWWKMLANFLITNLWKTENLIHPEVLFWFSEAA